MDMTIFGNGSVASLVKNLRVSQRTGYDTILCYKYHIPIIIT